MVVAWEGARSVICAASYDARQFGLHSAMSVATAKRLCPQAVYVPPHFDLYRQVSAQIHAVFRRYTDLIEPLSPDEAYLDVTRNFKISLTPAKLPKKSVPPFCGNGFDRIRRHRAEQISGENCFRLAQAERAVCVAAAQSYGILETLPLGKIPGAGKVTLKNAVAGYADGGRFAPFRARRALKPFRTLRLPPL